MTKFDNKFNELFLDAQDNPSNYSAWDIEFLDSLENWSGEFTERQEEKVNELYERHLG